LRRHINWPPFAYEHKCPNNGYSAIASYLKPFGYGNDSNGNRLTSRLIRESFDKTPGDCCALLRIKSGIVSIVKSKTQRTSFIVQDIIRDLIQPIAESIPDIDMIYNT
jgi:hypothetical protein